MFKSKNPYDTAICVCVKRHNHTFFVVADEYDTLGAFKQQLLNILIGGNGFPLPFNYEEELTIEDLKLFMRNR